VISNAFTTISFSAARIGAVALTEVIIKVVTLHDTIGF